MRFTIVLVIRGERTKNGPQGRVLQENFSNVACPGVDHIGVEKEHSGEFILHFL